MAAAIALAIGPDGEPPPPPGALTAAPMDRVGIEPVRARLPFPLPAGEGRTDPRPAIAAPAPLAIGRLARRLAGEQVLAQLDAMPVVQTIVDDRDAIELLLLGRSVGALTSAPVGPADRAHGLRGTPLGVELFAIVVDERSPVHNLSAATMRRLLTGQLHDRRELGLPAGVLQLGVPAAADVRERAARALIPGDPFAATATPLTAAHSALELLQRDPQALAVVHLGALPAGHGLRPVAIDGTAPDAQAFARGSYPYGTPLSLVTIGAGNAATTALLAALGSGRCELPRDVVGLWR